jgi:hypothetical protein
MNVVEIQELYSAAPFEPFEINADKWRSLAQA